LFFFELARPRSDDFVTSLNDRERQSLYDSGLYALAMPLDSQVPRLSVMEVARHPTVGGISFDREPDGSIKLRSAECCNHLPLCGVSNVPAGDVAREVLRFESALTAKLADLVKNRATATDEKVAIIAAWAHREIVRIRPLPQGNLVLAEIFAAILFSSLGLFTAAAPSPAGTTGAKISQARVLRAELLRTTYDELIHLSAMSDQHQGRLGAFFLGRISARVAA